MNTYSKPQVDNLHVVSGIDTTVQSASSYKFHYLLFRTAPRLQKW